MAIKKKGIPPIIPPNAKLIFDIELLEVSPNEVNVNKIQLNLDSVSNNDQKAELDNYKKSVEQSQEMFKKSIRNFFLYRHLEVSQAKMLHGGLILI